MADFDWQAGASLLKGFGGEPTPLYIPKTGLPFFDALQLYGAIDLYIGLREDVAIHDAGTEWKVQGHCRTKRLRGKDTTLLKLVREGGLKPKPPRDLGNDEYCETLRGRLSKSKGFSDFQDSIHQANGPFSEFDSAMQSGIRGTSAASYKTIKSGESSAAECIARIPMSQGLWAFAGRMRTEVLADILFLPVFEGRIDLAKVVSPVRAKLACPNVLCAQALMVLALKTSLFAEGYQERLTAVVYNKRVRQSEFAYSGQIDIRNTVPGRVRSAPFAADLYSVFRSLVGQAWGKGKDAKEFVPDALAMGRWVMGPARNSLSALITSQERLKARGRQQIFTKTEYTKEVWEMAYGQYPGSTEDIQRFARAVAKAIRYGRLEGKEDPGKRWYDEVATLRAAPNDKAFFNRALNLLEVGHREKTFVGTEEQQRYDPDELMRVASGDFETFRDLFRMYLIQESRPENRETGASASAGASSDEEQTESTERQEGNTEE